MLGWFQTTAPIRRKFDVLLTIYVSLAAMQMLPVFLCIFLNISPLVVAATSVIAISGIIITGRVSKELICAPYVSTVVRMEALAKGDFESPIAFANFTDCVGRMIKALEVFRANGQALQYTKEQVIGGLGEGLSRLANNDVTFRIEKHFSSDYDGLRRDYNQAMDAVAEVLGRVVEATNGIRNGSSDIRQASDDLSHRTEQQAASLEETAAAMEEITGTVRETALSASQVDRVVRETRAEAEQSGDVVRRTVEAMSGIERASIEIGDIIGVIDGIAFQTNLLALNAGVEAARSGDAGMGFAVVASEVRALAQRSADAAKDVKLKVTASSAQVRGGVQLVAETGDALQRIISRISEIAALIETIAASADHQSTGLQQVNTAVSEMDSVTQRNAAMVEEATAAARSLAEEADELGRQVAQFTLNLPPEMPSRTSGAQVHNLRTRAATAGRLIARTAKQRVAGGGQLAVVEDDWSQF